MTFGGHIVYLCQLGKRKTGAKHLIIIITLFNEGRH